MKITIAHDVPAIPAGEYQTDDQADVEVTLDLTLASDPGEPAQPSEPPGTTSRTFAASALHWRDTSASEKVDVAIALTDGTALRLDAAPVGVSALLEADGTPHAQLAVARYADCVVIENCWMDGADNLAGQLTVSVGGRTVVDHEDTQFWLFSGTAPIRAGLKQFTPADIRGKIGKMLPNFGAGATIAPSPISGMAAGLDRAGLNGLGKCMYTDMGATGGRGDIGLIPAWDLAYACNDLAWDVCRAANDHAMVHPVHVRDPETGMPIDPAQHPCASTTHYVGETHAHGTNPIRGWSSCPYTPDQAHQPHFGVVPYLATGSDFDLEQVAFWAAWQIIACNEGYRGYGDWFCFQNQTRGMAWSLASVAYAAKLLPQDHPLAISMRAGLKRTAAHFWTQTMAPGKPGNNPFGVYGIYTNYADGQGRYRGIAPWQNYFLASALQLLVQYGYTEFQSWRDFSASFANGMMDACYQAASVYDLMVVDPAKYPATGGGEWQPTSEWYTTWDAVIKGNLTPTQLAAGVGKMLMAGNPATAVGYLASASGSPESYPANLQPALAAAVDASWPGAQDAWATFLTWCSTTGKIDYASENQFNIVPHAEAT